MTNELDSKAIAILSAHARVSWAELAQQLGLSAPAAADRVRRLEERGVIRGYTAVLDAEALGYPLTAFVALTLERPERRQGFIARLGQLPEVIECHHTAGDDDYLLKVRTKGTRDLDRLLSEEIKGIEGVLRTRTTVVLSTWKETLAVPLNA
jgi:Lrp/AsnC family leucine-responsive transcriptional regulator